MSMPTLMNVINDGKAPLRIVKKKEHINVTLNFTIIIYLNLSMIFFEVDTLAFIPKIFWILHNEDILGVILDLLTVILTQILTHRSVGHFVSATYCKSTFYVHKDYIKSTL